MRSWAWQALRESGKGAGEAFQFAYSIQYNKGHTTDQARSPWKAVC